MRWKTWFIKNGYVYIQCLQWLLTIVVINSLVVYLKIVWSEIIMELTPSVWLNKIHNQTTCRNKFIKS